MNVFLARLKAKKASLFHSLVRKVEKNEKKHRTHLTLFSSHDSKFPSIYAAFLQPCAHEKATQRSRLHLDLFVGLFHVLKAAKKVLVNAGKLFVTRIKPSEVSKILFFPIKTKIV